MTFEAFSKAPFKSTKHSSYFDVYDELLSQYIGREITLVEIGVLSGGSLFMWREFLGRQARIVGIDINPEAKKWESQGFEIWIGDVNNRNFWLDFQKNFSSQIDIFIDDGPHTYLAQITTFQNVLELMSSKSLVIVEDTHTSYLSGFGFRKYSFVKYVKLVVDQINFRSSKLLESSAEHRIYSIKFYESIVVFFIEKAKTSSLSNKITNSGQNSGEVDFRYQNAFRTKFFLAKLEIKKFSVWKFFKYSLTGFIIFFKFNFQNLRLIALFRRR